MAVIRLTKEFSFEAAHALDGYDRPVPRDSRGTPTGFFVTVKGSPLQDPENPQIRYGDGFRRLETHRKRGDRFALRPCPGPEAPGARVGVFRVLSARFGNVVTVDYQPTCENMLGDFAARIAARLPEGVTLHSLRLHETATSFAEWFAEDQCLTPPLSTKRRNTQL